MSAHYCNYIGGKCDVNENECRKVPAVACRNRRMKIAAAVTAAQTQRKPP